MTLTNTACVTKTRRYCKPDTLIYLAPFVKIKLALSRHRIEGSYLHPGSFTSLPLARQCYYLDPVWTKAFSSRARKRGNLPP